jgi:hypothetical protein
MGLLVKAPILPLMRFVRPSWERFYPLRLCESQQDTRHLQAEAGMHADQLEVAMPKAISGQLEHAMLSWRSAGTTVFAALEKPPEGCPIFSVTTVLSATPLFVAYLFPEQSQVQIALLPE